MSKVIGIQLEGSKDLRHYRTDEENINMGDYFIVDTIIGEEIGKLVKSCGKCFNDIKHISAIPQVLRRASKADIDSFKHKREEESVAHNYCIQKIQERQIPIKLVRVSFFTSEKKAIFYFTSEGRIDFRDLVRDLAKKLRMRIEMKQIGIRDESKMVGGIGICGRTLCCKQFLTNIEPITLQMAKKQNLNMNPLKISGQCGRLMCCLSYEDSCGGRVFVEDEDELVGYNEEEELGS